MRTSEPRRSIPGITERMLIRHLQELVRDGILLRQSETTAPRSIHYAISDYGLTLLPVLEVICAWGRNHLQRGAAEFAESDRQREPNTSPAASGLHPTLQTEAL